MRRTKYTPKMIKARAAGARKGRAIAKAHRRGAVWHPAEMRTTRKMR